MSNPFLAVSPSNNSFLPEDYIARKAEARVNILILTLFAVVLGAVVGAFMVTNQRWQKLRERQVVVSELYLQEGKKIEQLKELETQRAQMMDKAQITAALIEKIPRWALLSEITFRMPESMRLDLIQLKSTRVDPATIKPTTGAAPAIKSLTDKIKGEAPKDNKPKIVAPKFTYVVTISGAAKHNNDVATFLTSLKTSPVLAKVELTFIREIKEKEDSLRKFEVTATLAGDVDTEKVAASLGALLDARVAKMNEKLPEPVATAPDALEVDPMDVPEPDAAPVDEPMPDAVPTDEPMPEPMPEDAPQDEPAPEDVPQDEPMPEPEPAPEPQDEPAPEPAPQGAHKEGE